MPGPIPSKILVIKLRHHGDVLLTTAFLRHLRLRFPQAELHFLIYKETTPLVSHNDHITQLWTVDRTVKGWARIKAEWNLIHQVRATGFDVVFHQTDQWNGALAALFSKAAQRVSFLFFKRDNWLWKRCFTHLVPQPAHDTVHAAAYNFLLLPPLQLGAAATLGQGSRTDGAKQADGHDSRALQSDRSPVVADIPLANISPKTAPCHLPITPSLAAQAAERLKSAGITKQYVHMHPPARWGFKCWEEDRFAAVIDFVVAKGYQVVLTSGPGETEVGMVDRIVSLCKTARAGADVVSLAGKVNLPLVAAFLKQCSFYVGVDSAPMHMAAALNVPQVCLFGPTRVNEWRPWSDNATLIYAGDYGVIPSPDGLDTSTSERYLKPIETQTVLTAITELLNRHFSPNRG